MTRRALWLVALVLATRVEAADDKARSRDGSGSSGHASDAGSRHHATSSSGRDHGSGSAQAGASSAQASGSSREGRGGGDLGDAQRRHPRAGTGTGDRLGRYHYRGYGRSYGYRSYYHGGFGYYPYGSYYYGYPSYDYSGYYGYAPYYAGRPYGYGYGYRETGSLRVMVDPEKTRVYVDGYYAGVADDFDGLFQRLHLSSGRHDITLKLEGYRTHRFRVYVPVDHTVKLHYGMVRGAGEDSEEIVGEPDMVGRPAGYARLEDDDRYDGVRDRDDRRAPEGDGGTVRLDVRPGDASIYVDGTFRGAARDLDRLRLSPGRHHIEMVRPGYRTLEREVEVRPGETSDVRADLDRS